MRSSAARRRSRVCRRMRTLAKTPARTASDETRPGDQFRKTRKLPTPRQPSTAPSVLSGTVTWDRSPVAARKSISAAASGGKPWGRRRRTRVRPSRTCSAYHGSIPEKSRAGHGGIPGSANPWVHTSDRPSAVTSARVQRSTSNVRVSFSRTSWKTSRIRSGGAARRRSDRSARSASAGGNCLGSSSAVQGSLERPSTNVRALDRRPLVPARTTGPSNSLTLRPP